MCFTITRVKKTIGILGGLRYIEACYILSGGIINSIISLILCFYSLL